MEQIISDKVRVMILGREYEVDAGGLIPLEIHELASYVDERMREIRDKYGIVDTSKIAVLAALNIAYDARQEKQTGHSHDAQFKKKIDTLTRLLDQALKD